MHGVGVVNDKESESAIVSLLEELLESSDFYRYEIESRDMELDFIEWKERVISALKARD